MQRLSVLIGIAVVLILVGLGYVLFFNPLQKSDMSCSDITPQPKIVAFGDSLVSGYGSTKSNDFVSLLSVSSGVPIVNMGRLGDTTATAFVRIQTVIEQRPDIVILLVGGNDALRATPLAETERNLESIVSVLQQNDIKVVMAGIVGGVFTDPYRPMFERVAEKYELEYVPNVLSGIIGKKELMSDEIHPNDAGYARIAEKMLPALTKACTVSS